MYNVLIVDDEKIERGNQISSFQRRRGLSYFRSIQWETGIECAAQ